MSKSREAMKRSNAYGSDAVKERGGFQYEFNGRKYTFQVKNGAIYDVSDLADIPKRLKTDMNASQLVERLTSKGNDVKILSPEQMQAIVDARKAERAARANIDYELGVGVPGGNAMHRKAARQGRLNTRMAKRR